MILRQGLDLKPLCPHQTELFINSYHVKSVMGFPIYLIEVTGCSRAGSVRQTKIVLIPLYCYVVTKTF